MSIESSLDQLCEAFDPVPYPGDDGINACERGCHDEMQAALTGVDWKEFLDRPFEVLGYFHREPKIKCSRDDFHLLTPEAVHYFAPLLASACLQDAEEADVLIDCLCHILTREDFLDRITAAQRQALHSTFLETFVCLDYCDDRLLELVEKLDQ